MASVLVLGTFDTKGAEYAFAVDLLRSAGVDVTLADVGILDDPPFVPDFTADQVAAEAGIDRAALAAAKDRGAAVTAMAAAASALVRRLHAAGEVQAAFALGGTGGTSLAAQAFRELPLGVPKLIVSTAASGETSQYIAESDLVLTPSIVDIAGVNRISAQVISNGVAALVGMLTADRPQLPDDKPLVAASMFGVTTECISTSRSLLDALGYETLTFHMTGTGGRALESLVRTGAFSGVLDITTTELADELVGGVFSAGPGRLSAAAQTGTPQVVSVGALDMVNFGPRDTVPGEFRSRNLYVHNSSVTLMRTTPDECAELGRRLAERVSAAVGPSVVLLPLRGISAIAVEGGPFHDPAADAALFDAVRSNLSGSQTELVEIDAAVNDESFARTAVSTLHELIAST